MSARHLALPRLFLLHLFGLLIPVLTWSQAIAPQSRITQTVNDAALTTLKGNTHPLAQALFDRGAAPPDLPMARMLLVLTRSDAQDAALEKLLDDQQDQSSPSYHQWLTPNQFGQQFGPSDQDIQAVTLWLRSHGFQIGQVSRGRSVIEFSGTALQVQQAFHAEIRKFTVNGEDHWANASDPQIPAALAPVVEGIASLHNFPHRPLHRMIGRFSRDSATGRVSAQGSDFTTTNGCPGGLTCYFVGPYDFAKIYNVLPLWNATPAIDGTGESIAIADISNINVQDVTDFRNLFFPTLPANPPQIFLDGPDPGLVPGAETEAVLDVEWAGAVAKGATIKLVVSAPTNSTEGADLAALYAIENSLASIVSESFGNCELFLGSAGNRFQNAIRQQASAQGITFITASGDQGSATCDGGGTPPAPAMFGLEVSGLASSPYGVAVGGTDFLNFGPTYQINSPSPYWNPTNDATQASAIAYVPETTWNDSCTNNVFVFLGFGTTPEASCNSPQIVQNAPATIVPVGGGGGKSNCTSPSGSTPSSCAGQYAKPAWQSALSPADGARDVPDVSLFASDGFMGSGYILCEADQLPAPQTCSLNTAFSTFLGVGGTSASAPAFAGIMALVNQFTGASGQGNANYVLYKLAASSAQTSQNCGATSSPAAGCIFYDVTNGTIAVPCAKGSTSDCTTANPADTYGVLNGYNAGPGYDLATGLGSVNAYNLAHDWAGPKTPSTATLTLTLQNGTSPISISHGQNVNVNIAVTPAAATGVVSLVGLLPGPSGSGTVAVPAASFVLQQNGTASGTAILAGGQSYQVHAHYSGDGTYTPSDSAPVTVTVAKEASKTLITIPVFDPKTGAETGNTPTTIAYGTFTAIRVDVGNASATATFPEQLVCAPLSCPTGNVALSDALNGGAPTLLSPSIGFPLSSGGYALDYNIPLLAGGTHQVSASYAGDNSFSASSNTYALTVTPAATRIIPSNPPLPPVVATPFGVGAILTMNIFGAMPSCNFTFYDGTTTLQGTPVCTWQANGPFLYVGVPVSWTTAGTHTYSAKFSGDSNYDPSTSAPMTTQVFYGTTMNLAVDKPTVQYGTTVTLTSTVDSTVMQGPAMANTIKFISGADAVPGSVTYTPVKDPLGNTALQGSVTFTPQTNGWYDAYFPGDSNYYQSNSNSTFITVNIPGFSVAANQNSSLPITAGQSATTTITVTPATNSTSPVTLACYLSYIPGSTCSFSPSTLTLSNSNPANATLTISVPPPSGSNMLTSVPRMLHSLPSSNGWRVSVIFTAGLAFLLFVALPRRSQLHRTARAFASACLLGALTISCGGGGGAGGTDGGQVATSLSLVTSAIKAPSTAPPTIQARVNSSRPVTGLVLFYDAGNNVNTASVLPDGTASFPLAGYSAIPGTHVITASYSGDSNNMSSKTNGALNQVITGTTYMGVSGTTGGLTEAATFSVTIQ